MVTSISGNNVTWRDSNTGNLITDIHEDLELVNSRRNEMPYHNGSNGSNRRNRVRNPRVNRSKTRTNNRMTSNRNSNRNNGNNTNQCPAGQHWMPPVNGNPGYCMNDSDMPTHRDPTIGGRTKRPNAKIWSEATPPSPQSGTGNGRKRITSSNRRATSTRGTNRLNRTTSRQRSSSVVTRQRRANPTPRTSTTRPSRLQEQIKSAGRYFYRNGESYSGKVIKQNDKFYTTTSGTLEGKSQEVFTRKP